VNMHLTSIWFWQQMLTPHMAYLADALTQDGFEVIYVANILMTSERAKMGWAPPPLLRFQIRIAEDQEVVSALVDAAPQNSIHLCEGLRGNGLVGYAQQCLISKGIKPWILMETVDDSGFFGSLKRSLYHQLLIRSQDKISGILAIGNHTSKWLVKLGADPQRVFPFAYFLPEVPSISCQRKNSKEPFQLLFVGQLIKLKRLDFFLKALVKQVQNFELTVIGDGPMRAEWQSQAASLLPGRVRWLGKLPIAEIPQRMADADCLVLPSRHDGWGAVVSEALMAGTLVICSDACGSAGVVQASGVGGVFPRDDLDFLTSLLDSVLSEGPLLLKQRQHLASWAQALGVVEGARYLRSILSTSQPGSAMPSPPWLV
jgi:glycosyltransferase involved in cell wall biosynthesis